MKCMKALSGHRSIHYLFLIFSYNIQQIFVFLGSLYQDTNDGLLREKTELTHYLKTQKNQMFRCMSSLGFRMHTKQCIHLRTKGKIFIKAACQSRSDGGQPGHCDVDVMMSFRASLVSSNHKQAPLYCFVSLQSWVSLNFHVFHICLK